MHSRGQVSVQLEVKDQAEKLNPVVLRVNKSFKQRQRNNLEVLMERDCSNHLVVDEGALSHRASSSRKHWLCGLALPVQHSDLNDTICLTFINNASQGNILMNPFWFTGWMNQFRESPAKHELKYKLNLENISLHIPKEDKLFLTCPHNFSSW